MLCFHSPNATDLLLLPIAKSFPKILSSFALVPSSSNASHNIATRIMVVNKEGDLELCTMRDASKQTVWSPRGDLAIGGGDGFKVVGPSLDSEADERKGKDVDRKGSIRRGRIEDGPTHPSRPSFSRNVSSSYPKDFGAIPVAYLKKSQESKEARKSDAKKREDIAARVVEEDISIVMKKRASRGYGIGNVSVCEICRIC